jgi:hypothetical protein
MSAASTCSAAYSGSGATREFLREVMAMEGRRGRGTGAASIALAIKPTLRRWEPLQGHAQEGRGR